MNVDVTVLYIAVVFLLAAAIMKRFLLTPLSVILEEREAEELAAEKRHTESLAALSRTVAEAEEKLSLARREALKVREGMRGEGAAHLLKKLEEARVASQATVDQALKRIEEDTAASARNLPGQTVSLARGLAEKILGRELAS